MCCALSVASLTEEALAEFESHHLPPASTKAELALTTSMTSATAANDKMLRFMSATSVYSGAGLVSPPHIS